VPCELPPNILDPIIPSEREKSLPLLVLASLLLCFLDPQGEYEHFTDFSGDIGIAISDENKGFPIYLGTPTGRIEMYDPSKAGQFPLGCVLVGSPIPAAPGYFAVPGC
jgi:hypothetical protein